ncbi:MAG TPA: PAC2 family protein [Thermoleophilaceae bacterium]|nr:PAC2 family protein [Thermoleophilaceae bacterium]
MNDVVWTHRPSLRRPVLVAAFGGWNDAGDAASAAVEFIRSRFEPTEIARIELEDYLDFTETRPTARLVDSRTREIDWPATTIAAAEVRGADNDLIVVQGPEPGLRWRRYCETVITIAQELDVRRVVTLGSLLADVPHSRPVHVTGIGSDTALLDRLGFSPTSYEGPTGITGVLNYEAGRMGLPSVSLWASVPHYVAAAPNPKVALALVRAFEGAAGLAVDATDLEEAAEDYERQVNAAVASDPEVKAFVERLESAMDEVAEDDAIEPNIPSADMIASDFQRFLRQRRG